MCILCKCLVLLWAELHGPIRRHIRRCWQLPAIWRSGNRPPCAVHYIHSAHGHGEFYLNLVRLNIHTQSAESAVTRESATRKIHLTSPPSLCAALMGFIYELWINAVVYIYMLQTANSTTIRDVTTLAAIYGLKSASLYHYSRQNRICGNMPFGARNDITGGALWFLLRSRMDRTRKVPLGQGILQIEFEQSISHHLVMYPRKKLIRYRSKHDDHILIVFAMAIRFLWNIFFIQM